MQDPNDFTRIDLTDAGPRPSRPSRGSDVSAGVTLADNDPAPATDSTSTVTSDSHSSDAVSSADTTDTRPLNIPRPTRPSRGTAAQGSTGTTGTGVTDTGDGSASSTATTAGIDTSGILYAAVIVVAGWFLLSRLHGRHSIIKLAGTVSLGSYALMKVGGFSLVEGTPFAVLLLIAASPELWIESKFTGQSLQLFGG